MIELIIAISIMATITSICIMKYNDDNYQINNFARQLCSDIRYVRRENMLNNQDVYIKFDKENNKYFYILQKNKKEDKRVFLPKNVNIQFPVTNKISLLSFWSDGRCKIGGGTIIIDKNDECKYITIVPVSGRVLYKEGIYE